MATEFRATGVRALLLLKLRAGCLYHVHIVADVVQDYLVVAPTEWNFHLAGVLALDLARLQGDAGQLKQTGGTVMRIKELEVE